MFIYQIRNKKALIDRIIVNDKIITLYPPKGNKDATSQLWNFAYWLRDECKYTIIEPTSDLHHHHYDDIHDGQGGHVHISTKELIAGEEFTAFLNAVRAFQNRAELRKELGDIYSRSTIPFLNYFYQAQMPNTAPPFIPDAAFSSLEKAFSQHDCLTLFHSDGATRATDTPCFTDSLFPFWHESPSQCRLDLPFNHPEMGSKVIEKITTEYTTAWRYNAGSIILFFMLIRLLLKCWRDCPTQNLASDSHVTKP